MMITNEMREDFKKRTNKHITLVRCYGAMLGKDYSKHDVSKYREDMVDGYSLVQYYKNNKEVKSDTEDQKKMDEVTLWHVINEKHHPEYWIKDKEQLKNFGRDNPATNLDVSEMPNDAIEEMVCDWCAMSQELGTSPHEWFDKNVGSRWLFTDEQESYIGLLLDQLWTEI